MSSIKVNVKINDKFLNKQLDRLLTNDVRLQVNNTFAKMCDPYVPMDEGHLAQTTVITPEYIEYTQPYAHYMYEGIVYGPNVPIIQDGVIVGWYSPVAPKHPTGKEIQYSKERHPLAESHWDKAMLRDRRKDFVRQVENILRWKLRQING